MGFKEYITSILLAGLFIIAILAFGFNLVADNATYNDTWTDHEAVSGFRDSLNASVSSTSTALAGQEETLSDVSNIQTTDEGGISFGEMFGIVTGSLNAVKSTAGIIFTSLAEFLHIPPVVLGVLIGLLIITGILLLWRVIRAGE